MPSPLSQHIETRQNAQEQSAMSGWRLKDNWLTIFADKRGDWGMRGLLMSSTLIDFNNIYKPCDAETSIPDEINTQLMVSKIHHDRKKTEMRLWTTAHVLEYVLMIAIEPNKIVIRKLTSKCCWRDKRIPSEKEDWPGIHELSLRINKASEVPL